MSTQLALPPKLETAVQPKPTKNEVIEAMARVKHAEICTKIEEDAALRKKLLDEVTPEMTKWIIDNQSILPVQFDEGRSDQEYVDGKYVDTGKIYGCHVKITATTPPRRLADKLKKIHSLPERPYKPLFEYTLKQVRAAVNGHTQSPDRINALINSEDSKKALEKMLKHVGL